jgi:hypothetical protein
MTTNFPTIYVQYINDPYRILNAMIFSLYGEETSTHFRMDYFSMAYTVAKTMKAFNWANIVMIFRHLGVS